MDTGFYRHHRTSIIVFSTGIIIAVLFAAVPTLHDYLRLVDRLGYPGMFIAGLMYGSGLTASVATVIFVDSPPGLNLIVVGLLGGLGSALYDLAVFLITRHETSHGWLAAMINRVRERRHVPNWVTLAIGAVILASPLPDELAAGLFGINRSKALPFFLLSFVSNTIGVMLLSGVL